MSDFATLFNTLGPFSILRTLEQLRPVYTSSQTTFESCHQEIWTPGNFRIYLKLILLRLSIVNLSPNWELDWVDVTYSTFRVTFFYALLFRSNAVFQCKYYHHDR